MRNKFDSFLQVNNFCTHRAGQIFILWNPSKVKLEVLETNPQVIHCIATCKVTFYTFLVSFVYAFHTIVNRRPLWNNIMDFNANVSLPWMILGDFNNVLKFDEKSNGAEVTPYEIKDFANCCLHVDLTDVRSIGCFYTWTNNSIWSKIDRAMMNDIWVQNGAYGLADFSPLRCLSDHSSCIVSIHDREVNTRKSFKFFSMWTMHEDFQGLVQASWNFEVVGTKQFVLCKKLHKLKGALSELNVKHLGHISTRANEAKRELEAAQLELHDQPTNEHYQLMVARLRKKAMGLCEAERNLLIRHIFSEEIKDVLFGIGDDKSLGPDGYTSCFFEKAWGTIEDDFVGAIMEFFALESILKQVNHTVIALVLKSSHTPNVGDYMPISCCNVFYKVITKVLASRLMPILESIVDHAQAAFIEGKSMMENIHLAQELMRQYNRKRVALRCLLKIDLKKAYDSVGWNFLIGVLEGLHFPSRFVQWVMEGVTSPTYSVTLNGSIHGFFKGGKGLRTVKAATNDSEFNYHPKCGPLKITHLAFVDDLMLFVREDVMSVQILMDCLSNFDFVLGLRMNIQKSSLYTAGIHGQDLDDIFELTNFTKGTMPFRYLGIPLALEKLKAVLDRFEAWSTGGKFYTKMAYDYF
ncbi:uncharacterized protein LOC111395022 [Olea europaea var. sylvestris]|uniref:uncharacterized protein LOC111395022 n=1 Tax=Olea europaea var. sylvestris TaxID=158386 RepID=UPI000C1D5033|nr:uncharacterized protein LOC111395022 [Olea europaea var. sylvestris]